ncbi:MAG: DUF4233 domain-containing protein [Microbacteriaceae bacterium]
MTPVQRSVASIILGFETVVIFLGTLVLYGLNAFEPIGLPDWSALIIGGAVLVLCVLALALLKRPIGLALGWTVQVLVFLGGFAQALLFVVGAMFGAMWWYALRAGARIDGRNAELRSAEPGADADADTEPSTT